MEFEYTLRRKLNNEFDFLKVYKVVYNTTFSKCLIHFIYPEDEKKLTDYQKKKITDAVQELLSIEGDLECKFTKSYLDKNIIISRLQEFVKKNFPSVVDSVIEDNFEYHREGQFVSLVFCCNQTIYGFINDNDVTNKILDYLNKNFCGEFDFKIKCTGMDFDTSTLVERQIKSLSSLPTQRKVQRYKVLNPLKVFGGDILCEPELIKNQATEKKSVILAGIVSNLVEKEFTPKRFKNNNKNNAKNNEDKVLSEPPKRKYYTFTLTDYTGSIDCIHFCTASSEKHFSTHIGNGSFIVCLGDISKRSFTNLYQYSIKAISLCTDDEMSHTAIEDKKEYKFCRPEKIIRTVQDNLLISKTEYPDWIKQKNWVVFDCETTGLDPIKNDITEIGAVKIVNGQIVEKFQHLCKPFEPVPKEITRITGITDDMLKDQPTSYEILQDFLIFAKDCTLVGYNVEFDYQFIQNVAKRQNVTLNMQTRDCLNDAKIKIKYLPNFKLKTLVMHLGITLENAHRALYDATATAEAFLALSLID